MARRSRVSPMDNRWKPWTSEEDDRILESPDIRNSLLAEELHRSENAIRYRRAHLAAKMHLHFPNLKPEECAHMLAADRGQVMDYLDQWKARESTFDRFVMNRKRGPEEERDDDGGSKDAPRISKPRPSPAGNTDKTLGNPVDTMVGTICRAIQDEEGQISHLWNDPDMVPTLIKFYPGFRAYAEHVRGM